MRLLALAVLAAAAGSAQPLAIVSAASYRSSPLAPDQIVTAFANGLSAAAAYTVTVTDSVRATHTARPFAAAAGQVSFVIPGAAALGEASIAIAEGARTVASATVTLARTAPGLFTANANGAGAPAGFGAHATGEVPLFQAASGGGVFLPALFAPGGERYLVLYGTGIRGRPAVSATVAGVAVPVAAAVAHASFAGLDQVNLGPLPESVADRRGEVSVVITVDGAAANPVTVALDGPAAGQWGSRAGLIEANSEMAVAEAAGKIYVLGGYPSTRETKATVQEYDPAADRWTLAPPLPVPLNHNPVATVNGKLYATGGQLTDGGAGNFSDRTFEYDPATRAWRERARMPAARGGGVSIALDGKIYVAGSRPPRGADFAVYDPAADAWRTLPDLPTQRNHLAGATINGKIYIVGGRFEAGFQSPQTDTVEIYDPASNQWTKGAPMPKPRGGVNAVAAHGCLHVFGGEGNAGGPNGLYPDHDVYDPVRDRWIQLGPMPVPVHGVTGAVFLGGLIYLPGGGTAQGGNSGSLIHQVFRPDMVCR